MDHVTKDAIDIGYLAGVERYDVTSPLCFKRYVLNDRAVFAQAMIERWGCVSCEYDGEDSSGRQKMRIQTPEELVTRACAIAELCTAEFKRRQWALDLPAPEKRLTGRSTI